MTTTNASDIFGGSVPIGAIVPGQFSADANYLPCSGGDYLKASYPSLDYTGLDTYGSNTLTARSIGQTGFNSVAFGNGIFVVLRSGSTTYYTTTDGVTFTARTLPGGLTFQFGGNGIAYGNGLFVAMGFNNLTYYTSPDGITWTTRTLPTPPISQWNKVTFAGSFFFIHMSKDSNNAYLLTSPDGITWTQRTTNAQNIWDIAYYGGIYYGASTSQSGSTSNYYATSADGVTWTVKPMMVNTAGTNILGAWNAVAVFAGKVLMLAPNSLPWVSDLRDGYTFSQMQIPGGGGNFRSMRVLNGRLHLLNSETSGPNIMVTPDLINWKAYASPMTEGVTDAAFGNNVLMLNNYGTSGVLQTVATMPLDTTKFRTPNMPRIGDGDRYYIKAK